MSINEYENDGPGAINEGSAPDKNVASSGEQPSGKTDSTSGKTDSASWKNESASGKVDSVFRHNTVSTGRHKKQAAREDYIRAGLALSLIPSVGPGRINKIFEHFSSPMNVFSVAWEELAVVPHIGAAVARSIHRFSDWSSVDELLKITKKHNASLLTPYDSRYPELLTHIHDPPAILWVKGNFEALRIPLIAVVGTRSPTTAGRHLSISLTRGLVRGAGIGIVSGLAKGVDAIAHKTTLEENGWTVAVLGSGIDRIYPRGNISLAHEIMNRGGAVISEFLPGTLPDSQNFPRRNRIVSGMSLGVVVTESEITGGSVITVRKALDQNREVFIIPHDLRNPKGEGCNELIQRGWGKPVIRISDIFEELPIDTTYKGIRLVDERLLITGKYRNQEGYVKYRKQGKTGKNRNQGESGDTAGSDTSLKKGDTPLERSEPLPEKNEMPPEKGDIPPDKIGIPTDKMGIPPDKKVLNSREKRICRLLTGTTFHIDELSQKVNISTSKLMITLLELELAGIVTQKPGKKFTVKEW